jgi:hypothetical protein
MREETAGHLLSVGPFRRRPQIDRRNSGKTHKRTRTMVLRPRLNRDLDPIRRLPSVELGITVTSSDDAIGREFEGGAPVNLERLRILRTFNDAGAPLGPLLPYFRFRPDLLEDPFTRLADVGEDALAPLFDLNASGQFKFAQCPAFCIIGLYAPFLNDQVTRGGSPILLAARSGSSLGPFSETVVGAPAGT